MAIKKNISKYQINYNSKNDSEVMKKIVSKQIDNYFRTDNSTSKDVENVSFDMEHTVSGGETLTEIASKYGLTYQELANYNNIDDPNYIEIGQIINIPTMENNNLPTPNDAHTVSSGETLSAIASKYGLTYQDLANYNNIDDPNYIEVGQKIKIPPNINTENPNPNEKIAEDLKNISQKLVENLDSLGSILEDKFKTSQNSFLNNSAEVKDTVILALKQMGITINEEVIKTIVNSNLKEKTNSKETAMNIATKIKDFCKQEAQSLNSLIPLIANKVKDAQQKNLDIASNLKQTIADALKNINIQNLNNYLDMFYFAFFKNSSNTEYVINEKVVKEQEKIAIPTHGKVEYDGDYLYLNSPNSDFKFKIPLAIFEVDKNDKKKVKIIELEGEKKEEYIKKAKQYVTDYINETKNFDYDFIKTLKNSGLDKEIQILYLVNGGYSGMTVNGNKIVLNGNTIVYDDKKKRRAAQKILTHELGHAYDATKGRISNTEEWQTIYSQIHQKKYSELMSISMKGKENEWFARCVDNYYFYPERLTQIEINCGDYNNLYDYMEDTLNGK